MKKLKKLVLVLLSLAMLLSLAVPALAAITVDPNECLFCGKGSAPEWNFYPSETRYEDSKSVCYYGGTAHVDKIEIRYGVSLLECPACHHVYQSKQETRTRVICPYR